MKSLNHTRCLPQAHHLKIFTGQVCNQLSVIYIPSQSSPPHSPLHFPSFFQGKNCKKILFLYETIPYIIYDNLFTSQLPQMTNSRMWWLWKIFGSAYYFFLFLVIKCLLRSSPLGSAMVTYINVMEEGIKEIIDGKDTLKQPCDACLNMQMWWVTVPQYKR